MSLRSTALLAPILLLGFALALGAGCDATGDDDDSTAGDDDAGGDDDSTGDDDDTSGLPECSGTEITVVEVEPNNGSNIGEAQEVSTDDGDLVISGAVSSCANAGGRHAGDRDFYAVDYTCGGAVQLQLVWEETDTDIDLYVYDDADNLLAYSQEFQPKLGPAESIDDELGGPMVFEVACWDGPPAEYSLSLRWESTTGDDDDAGDDDDSSTGDDDDSSTGDDDDSSTGDDDDSGG